jgi:hypothetical protein
MTHIVHLADTARGGIGGISDNWQSAPRAKGVTFARQVP